MPGFDNNTMWANNVDFRGVDPIVPQVISDGQLLIGSTLAPNIRVNTLTAGNGVSIVNGSGTIQVNSFAIQQIRARNNTYVTISNTFGLSAAIPQQTDGDEILTATITPKSATNILVFEFTAMACANGMTPTLIAALFQDATLDAIAANAQFGVFADYPINIPLIHYMTAGTTSATTFKVRLGTNVPGFPFYLNYQNDTAGLAFGGTCAATLLITEYSS